MSVEAQKVGKAQQVQRSKRCRRRNKWEAEKGVGRPMRCRG